MNTRRRQPAGRRSAPWNMAPCRPEFARHLPSPPPPRLQGCQRSIAAHTPLKTTGSWPDRHGRRSGKRADPLRCSVTLRPRAGGAHRSPSGRGRLVRAGIWLIRAPAAAKRLVGNGGLGHALAWITSDKSRHATDCASLYVACVRDHVVPLPPGPRFARADERLRPTNGRTHRRPNAFTSRRSTVPAHRFHWRGRP